jgi:hypothetical protein
MEKLLQEIRDQIWWNKVGKCDGRVSIPIDSVNLPENFRRTYYDGFVDGLITHFLRNSFKK